MKKLLFFLIFLVPPKLLAQTFVYSYTMTVTDSTITELPDSVVQAEFPVVHNNFMIISYLDTHYYMNIEKYVPVEERHDGLRHPRYRRPYSVAASFGDPYSIRETKKGIYHTMWITPMRFHVKHRIDNLRAFVYSNDPKIVKQMQYESETKRTGTLKMEEAGKKLQVKPYR